MPRKQTVELRLSRAQLMNLRRLINRAAACAEGRCYPTITVCWYWAKPLLRAVCTALKQAEIKN